MVLAGVLGFVACGLAIVSPWVAVSFVGSILILSARALWPGQNH
jgi:hypothetical protein